MLNLISAGMPTTQSLESLVNQDIIKALLQTVQSIALPNLPIQPSKAKIPVVLGDRGPSQTPRLCFESDRTSPMLEKIHDRKVDTVHSSLRKIHVKFRMFRS